MALRVKEKLIATVSIDTLTPIDHETALTRRKRRNLNGMTANLIRDAVAKAFPKSEIKVTLKYENELVNVFDKREELDLND